MHGDAPDLAVHQLALARMQPCPDLQPKVADRVHDRRRAVDRSCGTVERGEEPVTRRADLRSALELEVVVNDLLEHVLLHAVPSAAYAKSNPAIKGQ